MTKTAAAPRQRSRHIRAPMEPLDADGFFALPDTPGERYELFEGVLILAPPPDSGHQDAVLALAVELHTLARRTGGRAFVAPTGVILGLSTVLEPDALYIAPGGGARVSRRGIEGPPDVVVEVASPSTRRFDTGTKLATYLEHGVREVWIVDLVAWTVTVHTPGGEPRRVAFGEAIPSEIAPVGSGGLERVQEPPAE